VKLAARDVDALLEGRLPCPVLLFYGPDRGLVTQRSARLIARLAGSPPDPFLLSELEGDRLAAEPQLLCEEAQALAFGGGRRVLRVRDADDRATRAVRALLELAEPAAVVLLEAGNLGPASSLRRLVERATNAAACPCYREEGRELARSLERLLAEHGLSAEPDALAWLTAHLGADAGMTRSEIEKLALYKDALGDARVRLEDVEAVVAEGAALGFDALLAALLEGDADAALARFDRLAGAGQSPVGLLRQTARSLERLLRMRAEVEAGARAESVIARARPPVFFRQRPLYLRTLQNRSSCELLDMLARLHQAEVLCKRSGIPEHTVCRQLLLELTAIGRSQGRSRTQGSSSTSQ